MIKKEAYELANQEYMHSLYVEQRLGLSAIKKLFLDKHNLNVSVGFLSNRLDEFGIKRRTCSEARRIIAKSLDWSQSFLDQKTVEAIDGFLIGDGYAHVNHDKQIARIGCGVQHKEFCEYLRAFFLQYDPRPPKFYPDKSGRSSGTWRFMTRYHPDLYKQASRWYPQQEPKKVVPKDVFITPLSVMLWHLGDGTLIDDESTCIVRLSTDSFLPADIETILIPKLLEHGIETVRTSENRIRIKSKSIPAFFRLIGKVSPIKCYNYKFHVPEWRFTAIRMSDAAKVLGVGYHRLSHLVKRGIQPCYRLTEHGKPRFLPEHLEHARKLILSGELY